MEKVSIIIPLYNAEKCIDKCINSILDQTYTNIEVLLINDGSNDNSENICNFYVAKDKRIKLFNKPNSGPSDSRNLGIFYAIGEYIQFVDADDTIEPTMIEDLINKLGIKSDLCICGVKEDVLSQDKIKSTIYSPKASGNYDIRYFNENILAEIFNKKLLNPVWNKLYKRKVIINNDIKFMTDLRMGEDLVFNLNYLKYCNEITTIEDALYIYKKYNNKNSLTKIYDNNYFENQLFLFDNVRNYFVENKIDSPGNSALIEKNFLSALIGSFNNLFVYGNDLNVLSRINSIRKIMGYAQVKASMKLIKADSLKNIFIKTSIYFKFTYLIYVVFWLKNK